MNLRARLRPMGVGEIIDETVRLYRENFLLFVATVAVIEAPVQIVGMFIALNAPAAPTLPAQGAISAPQLRAYLAGLAAGGASSGAEVLLIVLASVFSTAALAVVISNRYLGRPITVGDAYRATLSRFGALVTAIVWIAVRLVALLAVFAALVFLLALASGSPALAAILALLVILAAIALVAVMIYLAVSWTLISQVIVLEGVGGVEATGRSRRLIAGYWWKTLGLLILTALLVNVLGTIPTLIVDGIVGSGSGSLAARLFVGGVAAVVIGVLVRPIQIVAPTLLFYDLKMRKEAFGLEALARQQQANLSSPPPSRY